MIVRTVLGDVDPVVLGPVDYHEHLFQVTPLLVGDELADEFKSTTEAGLLHAAGIGTMVEATPTGLAPNPAAVARASAATGLHVVHVTGLHHGGHYQPSDPLLTEPTSSLVSRFLDDVVRGMPGLYGPATTPDGVPVRAGLIKAGIRYWAIGPFEHRALEAAASVSATTGCAIMVHLEHGSAAHQVLDLIGAEGVAADRVVLAHADRNLDPGLHVDLAARGAYLGYDGMARHREAPDSAILDCLAKVVGRGAAARVVLGGDVARSSRYVAYGGLPGLAYLPLQFLPRLRSVVDVATYRQLTVDNGARLLGFDPGPAGSG